MTIDEMKQKADVPVVVVDAEGILIYVNESFIEIFGWSSAESLGQSLSMIIPENLRDAHNMGFSRFLATENPTLLGQDLTLKALNKKGQVFDAIHHIIAEKIDSSWYFASTIKPI